MRYEGPIREGMAFTWQARRLSSAQVVTVGRIVRYAEGGRQVSMRVEPNGWETWLPEAEFRERCTPAEPSPAEVAEAEEAARILAPIFAEPMVQAATQVALDLGADVERLQAEVERLTTENARLQGNPFPRSTAAIGEAVYAEAERLAAEVERLTAENTTLRGLLAKGDKACPYCGLAAADIARCGHGFPGCPRMDDYMTGPISEAEAEVLSLRAEVSDLRARLARVGEGKAAEGDGEAF